MTPSPVLRAVSASLAAALLCLAPAAAPLRAQAIVPLKADPSEALAEALSAACRQDPQAFASRLTADNAASFRNLPEPQRSALLKRFLLLEDPGKPLLSNDSEGRIVLRCDAAGVISEVRFGATQLHDNLTFISVEMPKAGEGAQSGRYGLVREDGQWKLLSLGLLLLDVPQLALQWEQAERESRESQAESKAVQSLRKIATALATYREAFGRLPETLDQLGPSKGGNSPEQAGLLDAELAAGESAGYRFRYNIVPASGALSQSDIDNLAGFQLAATPVDYGKDGRKSFYLDSAGTLRGADKHGAVANPTDPRISAASAPFTGDAQP